MKDQNIVSQMNEQRNLKKKLKKIKYRINYIIIMNSILIICKSLNVMTRNEYRSTDNP